MKVIAHVHTDFKEKLGIPRQSGIIKSTSGRIVFEKGYRIKEAVRGLEEFSHIWILWQFSKNIKSKWSPTVRPPLLGGNKRVGVFATRSPFRPNSIGLSCVKLNKIEYVKEFGPVIHICGADILDNTPVYDIKPYLPYTDSHPDALAGFTENLKRNIEVVIKDENFFNIDTILQQEIIEILSKDPRPSYHTDERVYGMKYSDYEIKFNVSGNILYLMAINKNY